MHRGLPGAGIDIPKTTTTYTIIMIYIRLVFMMALSDKSGPDDTNVTMVFTDELVSS